jgi:hypothetical protein
MSNNISLHPLLFNLPELQILLNPLLLLSRVSDNSKFCNGPVNFRDIEIQLYIFYEEQGPRVYSGVFVLLPTHQTT